MSSTMNEPHRRAVPADTADGGMEAVPPALELARLRAEGAFHERLRDLTVAFSRVLSATGSLGEALQMLAADLNTLLGARRTVVWLHERKARQLAVAGSSHGADPAGRVSTDDLDTLPARGLRLEEPVITLENGPTLLAPLRGWRRALGTIVVQGPFTPELNHDQVVQLGRELGRHLPPTIENIYLLEEVLRQRRLLEDTFNSLVDLVVVVDTGLHVVQVNDTFVARVGLSRAELLDRPLEALVGGELAAWVSSEDLADAAREAGNGERTRRVEEPRLGGTFSVTITRLITQAGDPAGHVLVARDITHQTRLEHEREALRERLAQSEKLASLGQFVAGIAHEMNNPLQGVLGHLELMIETSNEARPLRRDLRRIYHEADRAAKIVRNLLVFTGSRRMHRRRLRVSRIVSRVLASRAAALQRAGIEVLRDDPEDVPPVVGDPLLLHQALLNVLINAEHAVAATQTAGRIEVRTAFDPARSLVVVTIRDTGPGIPPNVLRRMFDPFFTTKEVRQGTGLGLAITYGIVQDHAGTIHAANAPDGGAVITIELPAAGA